MHPADLIRRKRFGQELTEAEIQAFVAGVVDGSFGDAQLGAFLMAVCMNGMTVAETTALTLAMRDSGQVLDLSQLPGRKVDKHSTGGVGDKVSLVLAPLVAAAGVPVPMISGRGLGYTGGTIDKLGSIPGYRTDLTIDEFQAVLAECGYVMAGASAEIAPADRRMYAVRDVSGTVESIPLITASILSKKLAEGIDGLVMDIKCGRASFMKTQKDAEALMQSIVSTGQQAGKQVSALLTDMDRPLGCAIGNALEVREALATLRGDGPDDLLEITLALGSEMLVLAGVAEDCEQAETRLRSLLWNGKALQCCAQNLQRQGGDPGIVEDPDRLGTAAHRFQVHAQADGHVTDVDPLAIGLAVVRLGGGRQQATDAIDPLVGVVLAKKAGDPVAAGDLLATVHASRADAADDEAVRRVEAAFVIGEAAPSLSSLVLARL